MLWYTDSDATKRADYSSNAAREELAVWGSSLKQQDVLSECCCKGNYVPAGKHSVNWCGLVKRNVNNETIQIEPCHSRPI